MSCESCREIEEVDGVIPPCEIEIPPTHPYYLNGGVAPTPRKDNPPISPFRKGGREGDLNVIPGVNACLIPPLSPDEARVLEMRSKLITLGELVGRETILKMFGATKEDIEMLEAVEGELSAIHQKGNERDT